MVKIDNSPRRRRGGPMWWLILIVVFLIGATWLTAPRRTINADSGTQLFKAGAIAPGPKPSASLAHPGSTTLGQPGTDSRDNGTPNAGRPAPASDSPPAPAPAVPPDAGSKPI
jgi:hypothetical protein